MKKFAAILMALVMMMSAVAFADGVAIESVDYNESTNILSWEVSGQTFYTAYCDGSKLAETAKDEGAFKIELAAGKHILTIEDATGTKEIEFWVGEKPTEPEKPTESTEPEQPTESTEPEQPTESTEPEQPTESTEPEQPTESTEPEQPTESTEPEQPEETKKPAEPEEDEDDDDDDVPKTGDTTSYAVVIAAMALAAAYLVSRRFGRAN